MIHSMLEGRLIVGLFIELNKMTLVRIANFMTNLIDGKIPK